MIDNFNLQKAFNTQAKTLSLPMPYNFIDDDDKTALSQNEISIVESMLNTEILPVGIADSSSEFTPAIYQIGVYVPKSKNNGGNTSLFIAEAVRELFSRGTQLESNGQRARTSISTISQLMADDTHFKRFVRVNFTAFG